MDGFERAPRPRLLHRRPLGRRLRLVLLGEEDGVPLRVGFEVRDQGVAEGRIIRFRYEALHDRPSDLERRLEPHLDVGVGELAGRARAHLAVLVLAEPRGQVVHVRLRHRREERRRRPGRYRALLVHLAGEELAAAQPYRARGRRLRETLGDAHLARLDENRPLAVDELHDRGRIGGAETEHRRRDPRRRGRLPGGELAPALHEVEIGNPARLAARGTSALTAFTSAAITAP